MGVSTGWIAGGAAGLVLALAASPLARVPATDEPALAPAGIADSVGNEACRPCHKAIVESYASTVMARTSGPAQGHVIEGRFTHPASRVRYAITDGGSAASLSYSGGHAGDLDGRVELPYYVGSNSRGRTYLFSIDGFLFQSPINYYALRQVWDMSPGYQREARLPLDHQVDRTCLFCHTSRIQATMPGTTNRFAGEPFLQAGVGCERCHGGGAAHVQDPQHAHLVNPARLEPAARDSICQQCHLEGVARIPHDGRHVDDFRPGLRLFDVLSVFVSSTVGRQTPGAVSHVESLAASRCKQASGDRMTCTSCHDPHASPAPAARVEYYRGRCLACHAAFATGHHDSDRDCTACHMPRLDSPDISHTAVTDHRIVRRPRPDGPAPAPADLRLAPFGAASGAPRELGLAYAEIAPRGGAFGAREAERLLQIALATSPRDPEVLTRLAFLRQQHGDTSGAEALYRRAIEAGAVAPVAAANLGVILAGRGDLGGAIGLWQRAFEAHPYQEDLGLNLALGLCLAGREADASRTLDRTLRFNPDSAGGRRLRTAIAHNARCQTY